MHNASVSREKKKPVSKEVRSEAQRPPRIDLWCVYVHGFHYALELLSRLVFVFLYDIIRGYRILLVQAECSIIKLSFPFLVQMNFGIDQAMYTSKERGFRDQSVW